MDLTTEYDVCVTPSRQGGDSAGIFMRDALFLRTALDGNHPNGKCVPWPRNQRQFVQRTIAGRRATSALKISVFGVASAAVFTNMRLEAFHKERPPIP